MGKGRDKRRRKAKKHAQQTKNIAREVIKPIIDPPIPEEPDAPVPATLRPTPNLRSGAISVPEPDTDDDFEVLIPRVLKK